MRDKSCFWGILMIGLGFMLSCGDERTCLDVETSLVKINFVDMEGNAKNITLTSLKAIGNEDGYAEYADTTLGIFSLALNPTATNTTFIFKQASQIDTLGLSYSVTAKLISPECGLDASFDNLDTTFTTFEKVEILKSLIHKDVTKNIEITL